MSETSNTAVLELPVEAPVMPVNRIAELFEQKPLSSIELARYEWAITGLTPIMFDRMTDRQIVGLVTGGKVEYPKDEALEIKALRKMYSTNYKDEFPDGPLGIPNENLLAALRDTGKSVSWGQGRFDKITSGTNGTLLFSMVRLVERFIVLRKLNGEPITKNDLKVDFRKGNATQGTGAVGIIRPRIDEWGCAGHLDLVVSGEYPLSPPQLEKLINMAGLRAGLCSGRPGKQMPFGQFVLRHLKWIGGAEPRQTTIVVSAETPKEKKPRATRKKKGDTVPAEVAPEGDLNNGDGHPELGNGDGHIPTPEEGSSEE